VEKNKEIIYAHVTNPADSIFGDIKNHRAECETIRCSNKDSCGLYKRGECSFRRILGWAKCPYGFVSQEIGFTKRARKYHFWIKERKDKYHDVLNSLKNHSDKIAFVGDYVFLPYAYMTNNESIPFLAHGGAFRHGNCFLSKEHFTIDNIINMIEFKPHALMGGEITDYQKKEIPKFLNHLKEMYPAIYEEVLKRKSGIEDKTNSLSPIGRKAYLKTIKQGTVFGKDDRWIWNGECFISDSATVLSTPRGIKYEAKEIKLKPEKNQIVEIEREDQVDDNTEYAI